MLIRSAALAAGVLVVATICTWAYLFAKSEQSTGGVVSLPVEPPSRDLLHGDTAIDRAQVTVVVGTEAGSANPEQALCTAAEAGSGIGLWTCDYEATRGERLPARIRITASGKYRGVYTNEAGVERGFSGCCLTAAEGASE